MDCSVPVSLIPCTPGSTAGWPKGWTGWRFGTDAGASPLFPPQHPTREDAQEEIQHLVQRDPRQCSQAQTRWTLSAIQQACTWLHDCTPAGVHTILDRLSVVWKRARASIRSPDPAYDAKRATIADHWRQVQATPDRLRLVYLDEVTIERQPTVASAYGRRGRQQPRARLSHQSNTLTRVVATLDALSGRVCFRRATKITIPTLVQCYQDLRAAYPDVERIVVVQDNWPVHTHPDLLVALEPQTTPYPFHRPGNWPTEPSAAAVRKWGQLQLPIQIVPLPTYASWCNPIEKLWRWLRQDVLHLHPWAADLPQLRAEIDTFLTQFATGSERLLRYVGLST